MTARLDALTDSWNALHAVAFGRGLHSQRVSEGTAVIVERGYEEFREWRGGWANTPLTDMVDGALYDAFSGQLRQHEMKFNATRTIVSTEIAEKDLPPPAEVGSAIERGAEAAADAAAEVAKDVKKAAQGGAAIAAAVVVGGGLVYLAGRYFSRKGR